eukprot:CAMPEP_0171043224 /NCGR_PEP_ID=MMETSP0736-20130129/46871_1 /TAXON_ID=186038 /ORGANISM="Fragilariopsis kerguelensis, Strain L26-C5" /LENGTH=39 /DNA_ID= /DNA_START= /DNA_END= /DNA_ORIENTATION=
MMMMTTKRDDYKRDGDKKGHDTTRTEMDTNDRDVDDSIK